MICHRKPQLLVRVPCYLGGHLSPYPCWLLPAPLPTPPSLAEAAPGTSRHRASSQHPTGLSVSPIPCQGPEKARDKRGYEAARDSPVRACHRPTAPTSRCRVPSGPGRAPAAGTGLCVARDSSRLARPAPGQRREAPAGLEAVQAPQRGPARGARGWHSRVEFVVHRRSLPPPPPFASATSALLSPPAKLFRRFRRLRHTLPRFPPEP